MRNTTEHNNGLLRRVKYPGRIAEGGCGAFERVVPTVEERKPVTGATISNRRDIDDDDDDAKGITESGADCRWGLIKSDGTIAIV